MGESVSCLILDEVLVRKPRTQKRDGPGGIAALGSIGGDCYFVGCRLVKSALKKVFP